MDQPTIDRRTVMIREIDTDTWALLRGEAARRRWTTAAMLEHIVREWAADRMRRLAENRASHGVSSASQSEETPEPELQVAALARVP